MGAEVAVVVAVAAASAEALLLRTSRIKINQNRTLENHANSDVLLKVEVLIPQ